MRVSKTGYGWLSLSLIALGCGTGGAPSPDGGSAFVAGANASTGEKPASHSGDTETRGGSGAGVAGSAVTAGGAPGTAPSSESAGQGGATTAGSASAPAGETPSESVSVEVLSRSLEEVRTLDGPGLLARYALPLETSLGYDPASATGLERIQGSSLALTTSENQKLTQNGFVISTEKKFPSFAYGYKTLYAEDLPLYVSADSILNAVHHSFDNLLKTFETSLLVPELEKLLEGMRSRLPSASFTPELAADIDLYLTLAQSLLRGTLLAPEAGADPEALKKLYDLAMASSGHGVVSWFGSKRDEDFSQFKPRGHYLDSLALSRYFRAMILLGRVDLRLIETQSDGSRVFHRNQFDSAVALRELVGEDRARFANIDGLVGAFIGERDSMALDELDALLARLGVTDFAGSKALEDARIVEAIEQGGFGAQRIASRIIVRGAPSDGQAFPLDSSFALFGQRYTVDSHVFVNTTFDRVQRRMMPDPLDAAFGALGNDAALELLAGGFDNTSYVQGLAKSRVLVDAHESAYWEGSLYTTWLSALRALSPEESTLAKLPSVARTRAFQTRVLNTQLASWAELRRDTILYVKQSYTSGAQCEFPDAYVEPYPEFYARLRRFGERIGEFTGSLPDSEITTEDHALAPDGTLPYKAKLANQALKAWVPNFVTAMTHLERMAKDQESGTPHGQAELDFINQAVNWSTGGGCGPAVSNLTGWYLRLFFDPSDTGAAIPKYLEFDPTIADVHTQPTTEGGADVGRILHVGTGYARFMIVTVDTCSGPRAYAGLASSYAQIIEENWNRLNDNQWADRIKTGEFPDVPWMKPLFGEP